MLPLRDDTTEMSSHLLQLWFFLDKFIVCFFFLACEVSFEDTKVPIENVIGEVGGGFKVIHTQCYRVMTCRRNDV